MTQLIFLTGNRLDQISLIADFLKKFQTNVFLDRAFCSWIRKTPTFSFHRPIHLSLHCLQRHNVIGRDNQVYGLV